MVKSKHIPSFNSMPNDCSKKFSRNGIRVLFSRIQKTTNLIDRNTQLNDMILSKTYPNRQIDDFGKFIIN